MSVYSDLSRDPRMYAVSVTLNMRIDQGSEVATDDAAGCNGLMLKPKLTN